MSRSSVISQKISSVLTYKIVTDMQKLVKRTKLYLIDFLEMSARTSVLVHLTTALMAVVYLSLRYYGILCFCVVLLYRIVYNWIT